MAEAEAGGPGDEQAGRVETGLPARGLRAATVRRRPGVAARPVRALATGEVDELAEQIGSGHRHLESVNQIRGITDVGHGVPDPEAPPGTARPRYAVAGRRRCRRRRSSACRPSLERPRPEGGRPVPSSGRPCQPGGRLSTMAAKPRAGEAARRARPASVSHGARRQASTSRLVGCRRRRTHLHDGEQVGTGEQDHCRRRGPVGAAIRSGAGNSRVVTPSVPLLEVGDPIVPESCGAELLDGDAVPRTAQEPWSCCPGPRPMPVLTGS